MSMVFSIPGKTFLAGEYLALYEGPTLVFLSQPYFELSVNKGHGETAGIHKESPAGLFIRKHQEYFANFDLKFIDPYSGRGGFGASTAQFLGCYALWLFKESPFWTMCHVRPWRGLYRGSRRCCFSHSSFDSMGCQRNGARDSK